MSTPSIASTIFCCNNASPVEDPSRFKRELYQLIFHSFLEFANCRQRYSDILWYSMSGEPQLSDPSRVTEYVEPAAPDFDLKALENNPLIDATTYVIHLEAPYDRGSVYADRYFVCPINLEKDWTEISLTQCYATGDSFKWKAEEWELECREGAKFSRLSLRPNWKMRGIIPVSVGGIRAIEYPSVTAMQPSWSVFSIDLIQADFPPFPPPPAQEADTQNSKAVESVSRALTTQRSYAEVLQAPCKKRSLLLLRPRNKRILVRIYQKPHNCLFQDRHRIEVTEM